MLSIGLKALFQVCPNLHTINLSTEHELRDSNLRRTKYFRHLHTCLFQPLGLLTGGLDLTHALLAAQETGRAILTLAAAPVSRYFLAQGRKTTGKLYEVFAGVEDLRLQFRHPENLEGEDEEFEMVLKRGTLTIMLASASELRRLDLDLPTNFHAAPIAHLRQVFGETSWLKLESLSLRGVSCTPDGLEALMER